MFKGKSMKNLYLITILSLLLLSNQTIAQWTSLKAPNTKTENYGWLAVSDDGKNIAAYNTKLDLTIFQTLYQYTISHDFGATWKVYTAPTNAIQNMFWDGDVLYVQETNSINTLKKSSDFGETFTIQNNAYNSQSHIIRSKNGKWYNTYLGKIYVSNDKGKTWTITTSNGTDFMDYLVAKNGNIVASASKGVAYSTDGGDTWIGSTFSTTDNWIDSENSISMASDGTLIYLCKTGTRVYKSTDNGVTWQLFSATLPVSPIKLLYSGTDLIVLSKNGSTHKSTDGGKTFVQMTPQVNGILMAGSAMAVSNSNIYICGLSDIYIYGNKVTANEVQLATNNFHVFPNPCQNTLHLVSTENYYTYILTDVNGKLIDRGFTDDAKVDVSQIKSGLYILTATNPEGRISSVKIIKE
jgi:hypothetical protein